MASSGGAGMIGWAIFAGAPATLTAFAIHPALGLVTGFATAVAWRAGCRKEEEASERIRRDWREQQASDERARAAARVRASAAAAAAEAAYVAFRPKFYGDEAYEEFLGCNAEFAHPANAALFRRAIQMVEVVDDEDDLFHFDAAGALARQMPGFRPSAGCG